MGKAKCLICESESIQVVHEGAYGDPTATVWKCSSCTAKFLLPLLEEAEEKAFYESHYSSILAQRQGSGHTDPSGHFDRNAPEAQRRMKNLESYIRSGMRILEIGSSTGFLLSALKNQGAEVVGIEPDKEYREFANGRGLTTLQSFEGIGTQRFDLILHYYVLEHVQAPQEFLKKIAEYIEPNSAMIFEVPNGREALLELYDSLPYKRFGYQKAHRFYFSDVSLGKLLQQSGFASKISQVQRYDLSNHLCWLMEGKPGGKGRFSAVFSKETELAYATDLIRSGYADTLSCVAEYSSAALKK